MPFPYWTGDLRGGRRTEFEAYHASSHLEGDSRAVNVLIPPLKDQYRYGAFWRDVARHTSDRVGLLPDVIPYGILHYYLRAWSHLKYGRREFGDVAFYKAVEHNSKYDAEHRSYRHGHWEDIDLNRMLADVEKGLDEYLRRRGIPEEQRKQIIREAKALIPPAKEVADLLWKFGDHLHEEKYPVTEDYVRHSPAFTLMRHLAERENPVMDLYMYYGDRDVFKKLHKMHRVFYEVVKPMSSAYFKKPSGVEEFLTDFEKKEVEEEIKRLLEEAGKPAQRQTAPGVPAGIAPRQVYAKKEPFTIDDVDMNRVEKHPETGLPIIRNGDQIVVLPPHKHPKDIPDLHPIAKAPATYNLIQQIMEKGIVKKPEDVDAVTKKLVKWMKKYMEYLKETGDHEAAWKKIAEDAKKVSSKDPFEKAAAELAEDSARRIRISKGIVEDEGYKYTVDHTISEVATGLVQFVEMAKRTKELLKDPEKYGLPKDPKELSDELYYRLWEEFVINRKPVVGFGHEKRAGV